MLAPACGQVMTLRLLRRWRHLVLVWAACGPKVILGSRMIPRYLNRVTHSIGWSSMRMGALGVEGKPMAFVLVWEMVSPIRVQAPDRLVTAAWSLAGVLLMMARSSA